MTNEFESFELKSFAGYLSADVEIQYFENGSCKATFSLPLKHSKDGDTTWLNCVAWKDLAEKASEELKKGSHVIVFGRFVTTEYNGKSYTNLNVEAYQLIG